MSFNFLSPVYLFGLLGLAVPVLIHLLTRRQQKQIRFSAVYLLFQSQKRAVRKSAPNRLLLLLFRCLAVAFLSLALANPIFSLGTPGGLLPEASSANVFILDDSYSMATRFEDTTFYQAAVQELLTTLRDLPSGSVYSVVRASAPGRILQDWTGDPQVVEGVLKTSQASFRTTSIGPAVADAYGLLESASQGVKRIFILTDRDKNGWKEEEFPEAPDRRDVQIQVIDFSTRQDEPNQAAVRKLEVTQEFLTSTRLLRVKAQVSNLLQDRPLKRLLATLWVDGKKQSERTLNLPANGKLEQEFSFPYVGSDPIKGTVTLQEDALPTDNRRFFTFQPDNKIPVLVVDGDPKTVAHQSETFYVEQALNPFSLVFSGIEPTVSTLNELPRHNLLDYSVLMLCNVRELPLGYELELERFVMRGGALFIALGDQVGPRFYNEKLGNLLPVTLESLHQVSAGDEPYRLKIDPAAHPVLSIFTGPTLKEMEAISFHSVYSVQPRQGKSFTVPMRFRNKYPALIESEVDKGKVFLYVSSLDRDWNNFAIQPTFLPWIQRWVKYSARSLESITRQSLLVGQPFVWKTEMPGDRLIVVTPERKIISLKAGKGEFRFEKTFRPGVYQLYRTRTPAPNPPGPAGSMKNAQLPEDAIRTGVFTVNIDTRESDSTKISDDEIKELLDAFPVAFAESLVGDPSARQAGGMPLTLPFLFLMASMLFCEGWLVRRE